MLFKSRVGRMLRVLMWAFAFSLLAQSPASAGSVSFEAVCKMPFADKQPTTFDIEASIPERWNRSEPPSSIAWKLKLVGHDRWPNFWYSTLYADSISGVVSINLRVTQSDGSVVTTAVRVVLDRWQRTDPKPLVDDVVLTGTSQVPTNVNFNVDGDATFAVADVVPTLAHTLGGQPRGTRDLTTDFDGNVYTQSDSDPYTTDVLCRPNADQSTKLGTTDVYSQPPFATFSNPVVGSASMPTISPSTIALYGTLRTTTKVADGSVTGSVDLADVWARLTPRASGLTPISGRLAFVPVGAATGKLEGPLGLTQPVRVKVTGAKLLGITPLELGNDCQSKKLSTITYKSVEQIFSFDRGGTLEAKFDLSDFNGCTEIAQYFSPGTLSTNNTVRLTVKPAR